MTEAGASGARRLLLQAAGLAAGVALLSFPYIDLELAADLPGWSLDVPVADAAAALLVPIAAALARCGRRVPLPGVPGFPLLFGVALFAAPAAIDPAASLHDLVRKPVFLWLAWGWALAAVVATTGSTRRWSDLLAASAAVCASILLVGSAFRIAAGNALWWAPIEGLTGNQKTLAVALAPLLPLLLRGYPAVAALSALALVASASRTSWIAAAIGLVYILAWRGRPLAERRWLVPTLLVLGLAGALVLPRLTGSVVQLDALRSRHSIDLRAWEMFTAHPWLGMGIGSNVRFEQVTFPHYRVNGVDAHGVLQKLASEVGLLGIAAWLAGSAAMARVLHRARTAEPAWWAVYVALHVNLLLSTETFSQTHWAPLGLLWGLAHRSPEPGGAARCSGVFDLATWFASGRGASGADTSRVETGARARLGEPDRP